jgi:hypothetical protein
VAEAVGLSVDPVVIVASLLSEGDVRGAGVQAGSIRVLQWVADPFLRRSRDTEGLVLGVPRVRVRAPRSSL